MNAYHHRLVIQKEHAWDLETDLPWYLGCDARCELVPVDADFTLLPGISARERYVLGKGIGLLAAKAISEHERVLNILKHSCWSKTLADAGAENELADLGEQFFAEEAKHSEAFARYVEKFARAHKVNVEELNKYLPKYDENSFLTQIYKIDAKLGGKALWWTVAATEEESMELYKALHKHKDNIDPLFFALNRLHFEEEARHSSYAYEILRLKPKNIFARLLQKTDFLLARSLQAFWVMQQLRRLKKISALGNQDPFFQELSDIISKIDKQPLLHKIKCLYADTEHISIMLNPQKHRKIRRALELNHVLCLGDL